jgi:hypothetical protein
MTPTRLGRKLLALMPKETSSLPDADEVRCESPIRSYLGPLPPQVQSCFMHGDYYPIGRHAYFDVNLKCIYW